MDIIKIEDKDGQAYRLYVGSDDSLWIVRPKKTGEVQPIFRKDGQYFIPSFFSYPYAFAEGYGLVAELEGEVIKAFNKAGKAIKATPGPLPLQRLQMGSQPSAQRVIKGEAEEVAARVRCGGRLHSIILSKSGALAFPDHPDTDPERALVALGGQPVRCLQVLEAWRNKDRQALPPALRPSLAEAIARWRERLGIARKVDPYSLSFWHQRAWWRVAALAALAIASAGYRYSKSSRWGGQHIIKVAPGKPHIFGYSQEAHNRRWRGTSSVIEVEVPLAWYYRVYKRGLALVDWHFILDVLDEDAEGYTVLAGRQGRGFHVYTAEARVFAEGGKYRLRWME